MANTLGIYDPLFYANEALIQLRKALGMAGRVHRGYDAERKSFAKGSQIEINRPSSFTVNNAPATAEDLDIGTVSLTLDQWKEVKFKLTDKELSYTTEKIITDHIAPGAYALADNIDQALAALYKDVPWHYDLSGTPVVADVIGPRTQLFNNNAPVHDIANMHYMIDGTFEGALLGLSAFTQQQGAGDSGVMSQMRGSLGTKYGMEIFANQNTPSHTPGVMGDATGALTADVAKGATACALDAVTSGGTVTAGDTFVIAGDTQRYAITAAATESSGLTLAFTPGAAIAYSDNDVITISIDTHVANMAFHRNAFALAMAPLSEMGNELGAKIATVTDPVTGLALRSRLYYVGNSSEVHVALDVLYGVKTLDGNLACRGRG